MKKSWLFVLLILTSLLYGQVTQNSDNLVEEGRKNLNSFKIDKAIELFNKACDMKNAKGCYFLGFIYAGKKKNLDKALKYYKKSCEYGNAFSCVQAGIILNRKKDYKNALNYFKKAININDKDINGLAYLYCGLMYQKGLGVQKDLRKAEKMYDIGCKKYKNAFACRAITFLYRKKLLNYYKRMCNMENNYKNTFVPGNTCYKLAEMYKNGVLVKKNLKKAKEYYKKGCEKGNGYSCTELADILSDEKKYEESFKYYNKGCDNMVDRACYMVGGMYYYGVGTNKSYKKAVEYLDGSCENGYSQFCKIYRELKAAGY